MPPTPHTPAVGELVWDTARKRLGEVMDHRWSRYQLRPPAGGTEWHAYPEDIRRIPSSAERTRCTECTRIKSAYHEASDAGDREAATEWTVAMGRHQRTAHP